MSALNFNAHEVEPDAGFQVIPKGDYPACIVESELSENKNKNGSNLKLVWQILSGDHQNKKIFDYLALANPSEKAVQIAKGKLSAICRAVGVMTPGDSSELHNKPAVISVVVRKRDDTGEDSNSVSGVKAAGSAAPVTAPGAAKSPW